MRLIISFILEFNQYVIFPSSFNIVAALFVKFGPTVQHVISEFALDVFIRSQEDLALTVLVVLVKVSFILDPVVFQEVPIMKRKLFLQLFWILVVKLPISVELFIQPLAIVSWIVL